MLGFMTQKSMTVLASPDGMAISTVHPEGDPVAEGAGHLSQRLWHNDVYLSGSQQDSLAHGRMLSPEPGATHSLTQGTGITPGELKGNPRAENTLFKTYQSGTCK